MHAACEVGIAVRAHLAAGEELGAGRRYDLLAGAVRAGHDDRYRGTRREPHWNAKWLVAEHETGDDGGVVDVGDVVGKDGDDGSVPKPDQCGVDAWEAQRAGAWVIFRERAPSEMPSERAL